MNTRNKFQKQLKSITANTKIRDVFKWLLSTVRSSLDRFKE